MKMRNQCGYDDFCFLGWFELGGFHTKEIEEQMQIFAEEVMPVRPQGARSPGRALPFSSRTKRNWTLCWPGRAAGILPLAKVRWRRAAR
jgi:hypothetical protein